MSAKICFAMWVLRCLARYGYAAHKHGRIEETKISIFVVASAIVLDVVLMYGMGAFSFIHLNFGGAQ